MLLFLMVSLAGERRLLLALLLGPQRALMSTPSKRPPQFGPVPDYKTHFELWNEASRANGIAPEPANWRRVWSKPVLSALPTASPPKRDSRAPALEEWSRSYPTFAAVAAAALLLVLLMLPWKSAKISSRHANEAAMFATNVAPPPQPTLPVTIPVTPADGGPAVQLASTQIVAGSDDPLDATSIDNEEPRERFAPVQKIHLESSIRSQLARAGLSGIGVSVASYGDVFLNGTFLSRADERRATAMVRANKGVRDIYFSGTVSNEQTATASSSGFVAARSSGYIYRNHYRERASRSASRAHTSMQ
jgi:hypothetical protein